MLNVNVTFRTDPETRQQLDRIEMALQRLDRLGELLDTINERQNQMALDLTRLQAEIAENNSAIGSAVALINRIADELRDAAGNQDAVNALADQLSGQSDVLAAAVLANTTSEPAPAPEPAPEQPVV